jgi:hypothetical protein
LTFGIWDYAASCHRRQPGFLLLVSCRLHLVSVVKFSPHRLSGCQKCRAVVDTLRKSVTLYQLVGAEPVPGDAQERLYKVLDLQNLRGD